MKSIRQFIAVCVLALALSTCAFAGEMQTPGATQSPSRHTTSAQSENQTPAPAGVASIDPVMEAVLYVLQSMLPLI